MAENLSQTEKTEGAKQPLPEGKQLAQSIGTVYMKLNGKEVAISIPSDAGTRFIVGFMAAFAALNNDDVGQVLAAFGLTLNDDKGEYIYGAKPEGEDERVKVVRGKEELEKVKKEAEEKEGEKE